MSLPEPQELIVGVGAWVLQHDASAKGAHGSVDGCHYLPTTECTFKLEMTLKLDAPDSDFLEVALTPPSAPDLHLPTDGIFMPAATGRIPFSTTPVLIRITATPTRTVTLQTQRSDSQQRVSTVTTTEVGYFGGVGYFVYEGNGNWRRHSRAAAEDETNCASHFGPPTTLFGQLTQPFCLTLIPFFLSRVRDRSRQALEVLRERVPDRAHWLSTVDHYKRLADPPIAKGRVAFEQKPIDLDTEFRVMEIKGFEAPSLIGVGWPRKNDRQQGTGVAPFMRADPMETLLFFHASNGQNAQIYNRTPYPFGVEQMDHGFDSYIEPSDPLVQAYGLSIPYQIAAAGKQTVLLLPLNRVRWPELANLNFPEQAIQIFEEIHAAMLRFAGCYFFAPRLGRFAVGAFSAGLQELLLFHREASKHPALSQLIEEVYVFDTKHGNGPLVGNYGLGFKGWAGKRAERRVRIYNSDSSDEHAQFVENHSLPSSPFVVDSPDGRLTAGVVSDFDWWNANDGTMRFKGVRRPGLAVATTTAPIKPGDSSAAVDNVTNFRVGGVAIVGRREVVTITGVGAKRLDFSPPAAEGHGAPDGIFLFDPRAFETTVTESAKAGDRVIVVDALGPIRDSDRLLLAETEYREVESVDGLRLTLTRPLGAPLTAGARVSMFEPFVRTVLVADAPAGAKTLSVLSGSPRAFRPGDEVAFNFGESVVVTKVGPTTLDIDRPLKEMHRAGTEVSKATRRTLEWGVYHAMYVSVFITDAMRKSGFR